MNKIVQILLFILSIATSVAQDKYWITFKYKDTTSYDYKEYLNEAAIKNRTTFNIPLFQYSDVPVNPLYLKSLNTIGVEQIFSSRWLNSVSAHLSSSQFEAVKKLDFVEEVTLIQSNLVATSCGVLLNPAYVHVSMKQMQINSFIEDSLSGKGVVVGIIDAGFYEAQLDKMLKHIFEEDKILGQKDFLSPEREDIIISKATNADYHGRRVLDMIAGYNPNTRELTGMATGSKFYLARSEDGDHEFRGEEDSWIAAMEWVDSKGVRLISTSLGYAIKMDDPLENYKQEQMNGSTARITKAAQIATTEKGIFLVVSAGNEGSNPGWQIISAPADAQGVLSIGATKSSTCERIEYSSIGPEFLPYMKPNVSCYSPDGTSFSAPAVAGFVACLMQRAPMLDNKKIKDVIEKSGHLYPYGNNFIGYGIPKASRALKLLSNSSLTFETASSKTVHGKSAVLKYDKVKKQEVVLFHKKSEFVVLDQETAFFKKGKLKIHKPENAVRTTVSYLDNVIEIIWK